MSFLHQLKNQAKALQSQQSDQDALLAERLAQTEAACRTVLHYLQDLASQLSVLEPAAPAFTLDGKTPWPAMKFTAFRVDARRKMLLDKECIDYIAIGWDVVPQIGKPVGGSVSVNFPPDLERVTARLSSGQVQHERVDIRVPGKNTLQAIRFDYLTRTRGSVVVTAEHGSAQLAFRLLNTAGFDLTTTRVPAQQISHALLDELAKRIVGQPNRFA